MPLTPPVSAGQPVPKLAAGPLWINGRATDLI